MLACWRCQRVHQATVCCCTLPAVVILQTPDTITYGCPYRTCGNRLVLAAEPPAFGVLWEACQCGVLQSRGLCPGLRGPDFEPLFSSGMQGTMPSQTLSNAEAFPLHGFLHLSAARSQVGASVVWV